MEKRTYLAIDLKSFYASVECVERGLDPLTTNLVVADRERSEKTICLAVTPALKQYGIKGRPRLFEVVQKVREINALRRKKAHGHRFTGSSCQSPELAADPDLELDYLVALPRMSHYISQSTAIYSVYLNYVAPEDIHVYSIDEVFIDATRYLELYRLTAEELAMKMILDVLKTTGITATAGIADNLFLCKVAMDITAKHIPPDKNGVRIARLDEQTYRETMWTHRPLTDFWRVGKGYARKLEPLGIRTMGDIARCSVQNEELLYRLFGVNAELLIDHAWGWEPCTIADIKAYRPQFNSIGSGQVLQDPYPFDKARLVVHEMTDMLALDLVDKRLKTDQLTLTVGYDRENVGRADCRGALSHDPYGRAIPKAAHGTVNLPGYSSSTKEITEAVLGLFDRIVEPRFTVRRFNLTANHVLREAQLPRTSSSMDQLDLFTDYAEREKREAREAEEKQRERKIQETMLDIKKKYGKNAVLKGMNLEEGATAQSRNRSIGGHRA